MLQKFKKLILLVIPLTILFCITAYATGVPNSWSWSGFRLRYLGDHADEILNANWYSFSAGESYGETWSWTQSDKYIDLEKHNSPYDYPHAGETILIQLGDWLPITNQAGCSIIAKENIWAYRPSGSDTNLKYFYLFKVGSTGHSQYLTFNRPAYKYYMGESEGYRWIDSFNMYFKMYPSNHSHQWGGWVLT